MQVEILSNILSSFSNPVPTRILLVTLSPSSILSEGIPFFLSFFPYMIPLPIFWVSRARFLHPSLSVFVAKRDAHRQGPTNASKTRCIIRLKQRIVKSDENNGSLVACFSGRKRGIARCPHSRDQSKNLLPRLFSSLASLTSERPSLFSICTPSMSRTLHGVCLQPFLFACSLLRILCVDFLHGWMVQERRKNLFGLEVDARTVQVRCVYGWI